MHALTVPTINNNDSDALLVAWALENGASVQPGDLVATLETTKAAFELHAEQAGVLQRTAPEGQRYDFGATIGFLFETDEARLAWVANQKSVPPNAESSAADGDLVITRPARELIAKHAISDEQLRSLGKKVVRAADLAPLVEAKESREGMIRPTILQQGIACVVSRSHATIPVSFIVKKARIDAALEGLREFSRVEKVMAGPADLLVWIIARQAKSFPFFFGELRDDLSFSPGETGSVGVTLDLGKGLFVPVVRNAATMSLKEVAKKMMALRMRASRGKFDAEELAGGEISISLNMEPDTVFVQPIILPPQTCMLSIGGIQQEVRLDTDGKPVAHSIAHLGCAFDHRVINAGEAKAFLTKIIEELSKPAVDAWQRSA